MNAEDLDRIAIERYHQGSIEISALLLRNAIEHARNENQEGPQMMAMGHLCEAYFRLGALSDAMNIASDLLCTAREYKSLVHEVRGASLFALVVQQMDLRRRWAELRTLVCHSLTNAKEIEEGYWVAQNLETLGACSVRVGAYADALGWLQDGLNSLRAGMHEEQFFRARLHRAFAELSRCVGDLCAARRHADVAVDVAQKNTQYSPHLLCGSLLTLAKMEAFSGEFGSAYEIIDAALDQSIAKRWPVEQQIAHHLRSKVASQLGHVDAAMESGGRAVQLASQMGMTEEKVVCLLNYGSIMLDVGHQSEAHHQLRQARELAASYGFQDHETTAADLLFNV